MTDEGLAGAGPAQTTSSPPLPPERSEWRDLVSTIRRNSP